MADYWDERYSQIEYAYGTQANAYFKRKIDSIPVGSLLLPAEGEGRNAVYAATKGWDVTAFDSNKFAMQKANELAKNMNTRIDYKLVNAEDFTIYKKFDAVGLIYTHLSNVLNNKILPKLSEMVKSGGYIIFECFSINQLKYRNESGGPGEVELLFTVGDIHQLFPNFAILDLAERIIELDEGKFHKGKASVINFFGRKNSL